jgi:integrase/recombinase XerC
VIPQKNITPHKLRATYATQLYEATGDIYLVAENLGHKDIQTTKKHYANISNAHKEKSRNIISYDSD